MDAEDLNLEMIDAVAQAANDAAAEPFLDSNPNPHGTAEGQGVSNATAGGHSPEEEPSNTAQDVETSQEAKHEEHATDTNHAEHGVPSEQAIQEEVAVEQAKASGTDEKDAIKEEEEVAEGANDVGNEPPAGAAKEVGQDGINSGEHQPENPEDHNAEVDGSGANTNSNEHAPTTSKQPKKRVRRVGKVPARKVPKLEESSPDSGTAAAPAAAAAADENTEDVPPTDGNEIKGEAAQADIPANGALKVGTKHDEKWGMMFEKLMEYKSQHGHSMVPQCYQDDLRLGRWVHYQRVEYWIFQQTGSAKITPERIARLNAIGFEWDPQKAQWDIMYERLKKFKEELGHCRVPKGYSKDKELANWVRNQRLEEANMKRGKKTRMTQERIQALEELGFKWSSPTKSRSRKNKKKKAEKEETKPVENGETVKTTDAAAASGTNEAQEEVRTSEEEPIKTETGDSIEV